MDVEAAEPGAVQTFRVGVADFKQVCPVELHPGVQAVAEVGLVGRAAEAGSVQKVRADARADIRNQRAAAAGRGQVVADAGADPNIIGIDAVPVADGIINVAERNQAGSGGGARRDGVF